MRIIIVLIEFFVFSLLASCQNATVSEIKNQKNLKPEIFINISDLYQDSILVEYNIANIEKDSLVFKFQKVVTGTYRNNITKGYINKIQFYDANNKKLHFNRLDGNTFLIPNSKTLNKITYSVNKGNYNDVYDVLTKIVAVDSFCIINPASFIGYLNNFMEVKHHLRIAKPNGFSTFFKCNLLEVDNGEDRFCYNNYDELIENPLLYSKLDTISILNNDLNATISVYSDNKNITASKLRSWIVPLSNVLYSYTSFISRNEEPYRFIFIFSDEFIQESALEQKNASAYCFRSNWDTAFLAKTIQHIVAHEYFHIITPLNFHSNTFKSQLYENYDSKHLWLYEGVVEYLSIKANLDAKEISFNKFMQYLAMMYSSINYDDKCEKESLLKLSRSIILQRDYSCFQNFYYKGGLFAFILDLQISIKSKGKNNLISAIEKYIKQQGIVFDEDKFFDDFLRSNSLSNINEDVLGQRFDLYIDSLFLDIGFVITHNQTQWVETVFNQFFIKDYFINNKGVFISFNENADLKNKTVKLLEIDNTAVDKNIILKRLIYPPNSKSLEISYIYENSERKMVIKPTTSIGYRVVRKIEKIANPTLTQQNNLKYFIGY